MITIRQDIIKSATNALVIGREKTLLEFFKAFSHSQLKYGSPRARRRQLTRWLDEKQVDLDFETTKDEEGNYVDTGNYFILSKVLNKRVYVEVVVEEEKRQILFHIKFAKDSM